MRIGKRWISGLAAMMLAIGMMHAPQGSMTVYADEPVIIKDMSVGDEIVLTGTGAVTMGTSDAFEVTMEESLSGTARVGSSDTAFDESEISLDDCLYTFDRQSDGTYNAYRVSAQTADGKKVYLDVPAQGGNVYQPNTITSAKVHVVGDGKDRGQYAFARYDSGYNPLTQQRYLFYEYDWGKNNYLFNVTYYTLKLDAVSLIFHL